MNQKKSNSDRYGIFCYRCHLYHLDIKRDCEAIRFNLVCHFCGKIGHLKRACYHFLNSKKAEENDEFTCQTYEMGLVPKKKTETNPNMVSVMPSSLAEVDDKTKYLVNSIDMPSKRSSNQEEPVFLKIGK